MEHLQTVQQIFADKLLKVPDYQRGYAWEKRHWQDIVEDLEVLLKDQEHYTGTLVLHLDKESDQITDQEGRVLRVYEVVDGQQRLTSFIIFLHCISKELKQNLNKKIFAEGIRKNYIKIIDNENQEKARLTLNKDCHEFFLKNIISEKPTIKGPKIKSHERLEQALNYFWNYLQEKKREKSSEQEYESWIINLHKKITNSLRLTVYQVPHTSDVGVIFEVMNNRGKPLSEMEKVKNYLLYLSSKIEMDASQELGEQINSVWAFIFQKLMESGLSTLDFENQLLRSSWLMSYDYFSKNWRGYGSIRQQFNLKKYSGKHKILLADLKKYVEILEQSCIAYCDIMAPNQEDSYNKFHDKPEVRKRLRKKSEKLARIGNRVPFLPLLMASRIKFTEDCDFYEELLDISEKYAFRIYRIQKSRANTGQSNLFKQGYNLFNGRVSRKFVIRNIKNNLHYYSPEENIRDFFYMVGNDWYNFYGLKYFLYEYEEQLARGKGVQLPWDRIVKKDKKDSIEHILPQAATRPYWRERWKKEDIENYKHDIGNLTITFDNSIYSNKSFPDKKGMPGYKDCYTTSNLFQERELAKYADWTVAELMERRKKIVDWAIKRWEVVREELDEIEPGEDNYEENEFGGEGNLFDINEEEEIPEENLTKKHTIKEWSEAEIVEYLNYLKSWGEYTYYFFKVLTSIEGKIGYNELINRIKKESGRDFSGSKFRGVRSGLTRRAAQKGGERLDKIWEDGWVYSLNKKYKDIIKRYFDENE